MQIKVFTIPIGDPEGFENEANAFLRSHRILEVVHEFVDQGADSRWCLLVKTVDGNIAGMGVKGRSERIDYKSILDSASFARFCALRKARKKVAESEGVPAFAKCTDKQMAEMAKIDPLTLEAMLSVDGIGAGKVEKFGSQLLRAIDGKSKADKDSADNEADG